VSRRCTMLSSLVRSNSVSQSFPRYNYCRHPSIRTLDERFFRSVQVGCSRFSRCCHLIFDLSFHLDDGVGPGVRLMIKFIAYNSSLFNSLADIKFSVTRIKLPSELSALPNPVNKQIH